MFPRRSFTIQSALPADEARSRLLDAIGPVSTSLLHRTTRPFTGSMTGDSFSIIRTSRGRNSARPMIRGTLEAAGGGSRIQGTMRLHEVVVVFMGLLILLSAGFFLNMLLHGLNTGRWDVSLAFIPAVPLFLTAMMGLGFRMESRRALAELAAIVDGEGQTPARGLPERAQRSASSIA